MNNVISSFEDLKALEGLEVGVSDWFQITQDQIDQITKNVSQTIDMSVEFAEKSPKPSLESMLENVYGEKQE